jgi:hypothetical protein
MLYVLHATSIMFRNKMFFYSEELLTPRPTPMLEDHPLSTIRECLFNIFATTFRILRSQPEDAPYRGDSGPHNMEFYD